MDTGRPGIVFSTTFRYSLISLVELARNSGILQTRQIAAKFELSPHYLSVVLRNLRRLGLVGSIKGKRVERVLRVRAQEQQQLQILPAMGSSSQDSGHGKAPGHKAWGLTARGIPGIRPPTSCRRTPVAPPLGGHRSGIEPG